MSSKDTINISVQNMNKVMMDWFCSDAVLFGTWTMIEKVPSKQVSTISVSTKSKNVHIKYNPNFISKLSLERLELVMLTETVRVLLRHPTTRLLNPKEASKLASNITVYENVNKTACKTNDPEVEKLFKEFEMEHDQYFEEYFRNIIDKMNNPENQKLMDALKASSCSIRSGESRNTDAEGYTEFDSEKDAMKEYNNPFNGSADEWGENSEWDETVKSHVSELKKSGKNWGKHTGSLQDTIMAASKSGIDYRSLLANFAQSVRKNEKYSSRMKYNRRYGLDAPGKRTKETSKILFAIDVSGSMSDADVAEGLAIVNHTCRHSELTYLIFDTEIKMVEKNFKRAKKSFKICGRGGTDVQQVIEYADKGNYDGLVIFTDGYLEKTTKPKCTNVVWLLTEDHEKNKFGYGSQIRLNRFWKR